MQVVKMEPESKLFDQAVKVFWNQWGNEQNYKFYQDCMTHSDKTTDGLPAFYVALLNESIIGTYALIRNDLNSRQDLYPWLACLYIEPAYRGRAFGSRLLEHAVQETEKRGFNTLYLTSDLEDYYEKYGWTHSTEAYGTTKNRRVITASFKEHLKLHDDEEVKQLIFEDRRGDVDGEQ